jgi:tetratricopeptide (TPR) repeat protein
VLTNKGRYLLGFENLKEIGRHYTCNTRRSGMTILVAAVVFGAYAQASNASAEEAWPIAISHSKIARQSPYVAKLSKALREPAAISPFETLSYPVKESPSTSGKQAPSPQAAGNKPPPEVMARMDEYLKVLDGEHHAALALISQGRLVEARQQLERSVMTHGNETFGVALMDLEMDQGDYASAYKVAAAFIGSGKQTQRVLLRASLAASMTGAVFSGQREFLIRNILGRDQASDFETNLVWPGSSSSEISAMSRVLIASEFNRLGDYKKAASQYASVLQFDPGNPTLCYLLSMCYNRMGKYTLASKVANDGMKRAKSDYMQTILQSEGQHASENLHKFGEGVVQSTTGVSKNSINP